MTGDCGKNVQVCISLKGRLGLLDSTSDVDIGGHFVVGVFWRVVSVGSKLLSPHSQMYTWVAILSDLLYTTIVTSCLVLGTLTTIF